MMFSGSGEGGGGRGRLGGGREGGVRRICKHLKVTLCTVQ
jgi:hypothetical protein